MREGFIYFYFWLLSRLGDHFCLPVPASPIPAWVSVCCQWVSAYSIRGHTHVCVWEIWNEKLKWKQLCGIFLPSGFFLRFSLLIPLSLSLTTVAAVIDFCFYVCLCFCLCLACLRLVMPRSVVIGAAVYQSKYFGERVRAALSGRRRNRKLPHCLLLCVCV